MSQIHQFTATGGALTLSFGDRARPATLRSELAAELSGLPWTVLQNLTFRQLVTLAHDVRAGVA